MESTEALLREDLFQFRVHTESDARGLYAAVYQRPDWVTPEEYEIGMRLHSFYLTMVQRLALDYYGTTGKKKP